MMDEDTPSLTPSQSPLPKDGALAHDANDASAYDANGALTHDTNDSSNVAGDDTDAVCPITSTHPAQRNVSTDGGRGQHAKGPAYVRPAYDCTKLLNAEIKVFARPCLHTGVSLDSNGRDMVDAKGNFLHDKFKNMRLE